MAIKPKLAMIPSGVGTDTLYSVLPTDGTGDFDFERDGEATRINKDGLIETVSLGLPRLNYPLIDGVVSGCPSLLLEPESRNLIQYSEDFSDASWDKTNTSITSNSVISPDGTLNADKMLENSTLNTFSNRYLTSVSYTSGLKYTTSIFAKSDGRDLMIRSFNGSSDIDTIFDLSNGIVLSGVDAEIKDYGNGWYRCSHTITAQSTINTAFSVSFILVNNSSISYQGDGTSGIYIWGAQLEEQSYATSYIPNFGTALGVTRSAETCNNAGDVNTFNDSEGVLMAEISALANDGNYKFITLSDGTTANRLGLFLGNSDNKISAESIGSGTNLGIYDKDLNIKNNNKIALKYKANDCALWVNGFELGFDNTFTSFSDGTLTSLNFDKGDGTEDFYGNTKQIQYFDTALTDTDLEELTSWSSFNEMANAQQYTII